MPEGFYRVPIGKGIYRRRGTDVTIVGASHAIELGMQAATQLAAEGIDAEVIDLRTIKPLDEADRARVAAQDRPHCRGRHRPG